VFILQLVQLIILKVFFQEGETGPKAMYMVQIQRRKYSFEKKSKFLFNIKVNLRSKVCNVYNHHQNKKALIQSQLFLHVKRKRQMNYFYVFVSLSSGVFGMGIGIDGIYSLMV